LVMGTAGQTAATRSHIVKLTGARAEPSSIILRVAPRQRLRQRGGKEGELDNESDFGAQEGATRREDGNLAYRRGAAKGGGGKLA